ncbi:MAG: APC family permease [Planctomycetota bacterium]|jgi:amino acid transporter
MSDSNTLQKSVGTWEVTVAGVALVVAASTLVSDFSGYFTLGAGFAVALGLAFLLNLLLGLSAADLSVAHYDYARAVLGGRAGRVAGVFLALTTFLMFPLVAAGEMSAGALALRTLIPIGGSVETAIVLLALTAAIPALFGLRGAAWTSAGLLVFMLGIRWFFGLAGFFGWSGAGEWSAANLTGGGWHWLGDGGILTAGLGLAVWTFVGIEFACSLGEEARNPRRAMPLGIVLGLCIIFATSLVMGLGVTGVRPLAEWQQLAASELAAGGAAPQLAVGHVFYGSAGVTLMALASIAATLGTMTVAFAAMPRLLFRLARTEALPAVLARPLGRLDANSQPRPAILVTLVLYLVPAVLSHDVLEWIYSAAYVWLLLYVVYHLLALVRRWREPAGSGAFGRWFLIVPLTGIPATLAALWIAFGGSHATFGLGALAVGAVAALGTAAVTVARRAPAPSPSTAPVPAGA